MGGGRMEREMERRRRRVTVARKEKRGNTK